MTSVDLSLACSKRSQQHRRQIKIYRLYIYSPTICSTFLQLAFFVNENLPQIATEKCQFCVYFMLTKHFMLVRTSSLASKHENVIGHERHFVSVGLSV